MGSPFSLSRLWGRTFGQVFGQKASTGPATPVSVNNEACRGLDQSLPLEDCVFTVFDTELTGLNPAKDEIVSIGAVRIRNLQIIQGERFHVLVKPEMPLPKFSTLIHRITPERIGQAPALAQVLPDFLAFLNGTLLVGHYVELDMSFLSAACKRLYGQAPANPCLDTMLLAMSWQRRLQSAYCDQFDQSISYTLGSLSKRLGLPAFPSHDAMHDAMQTAYLFIYLTQKLRAMGIRTLRELHRPARSQSYGL